jgi:transcriptional regulator with XRE-family HTH domain
MVGPPGARRGVRVLSRKDVGQTLRAVRLKRELSQADLARFSGVDQAAICRFERGWYFPNLQNLVRLADVLGVSIDALLGRWR